MSIRSSLTSTGGVHHTARPTTRRSGTVALEVQAAYKFALATLVGLGAILADLSTSASALILIVAIFVAGRALTVLGAEPGDRTSFRPTGEAAWDATLAAAWAVLAIVLAVDGAVAGALVSGAGALALATLRLRTRYVL